MKNDFAERRSLVPSPFPGMNPYLEQADVWHDFHESLIPMLRSLLSPGCAALFRQD